MNTRLEEDDGLYSYRVFLANKFQHTNIFLLYQYCQECAFGFCGFSDTLDAFKDCLPGKKSYAQEKLFGELIGGTYSAHNALADVKALQELVSKSNLHHPVVTAGFTL